MGVIEHAYAIDRRNSRDTRVPEPLNEHTFSGGTNGQILVFDDTVTDIQARWTDAAALLQWFDVSAAPYGASPTATAAANTTAIQAAIDACVAAGGGTVYVPPGTYPIASVLTIDMGVGNIGLTLRGAGVGVSVIKQTTASADVLRCGNGQLGQRCDFLVISDLSLSANGVGGKILRLDGCLGGRFERLLLQDGTYGIYLEGQNENHDFNNIYVQNCTAGGLLGGVNNASGVTGPVTGTLNYPIVQKCTFRHVFFSGISAGPTFKITAGIYNAAQQSSGDNQFHDIRSESSAQECFWLDQCAVPSTLIGLSSEDHPGTTNTYSFLKLTNSSTLYASDLQPGTSGSVNTYKYLIESASSTLWCANGSLTLTAGTKQVTTNTAIHLRDCTVTALSQIDFSTGFPAYGKSTLINIRDASGVPLAWPKDYPNLSLSTYNFGGQQLAPAWTGGNWHVPFSLLLTNTWVNGETYGATGPIMLIQDVSVAPTSNPPAGYQIVYMEGGSLKARTAAGNIRTMAAL